MVLFCFLENEPLKGTIFEMSLDLEAFFEKVDEVTKPTEQVAGVAHHEDKIAERIAKLERLLKHATDRPRKFPYQVLGYNAVENPDRTDPVEYDLVTQIAIRRFLGARGLEDVYLEGDWSLGLPTDSRLATAMPKNAVDGTINWRTIPDASVEGAEVSYVFVEFGQAPDGIEAFRMLIDSQARSRFGS